MAQIFMLVFKVQVLKSLFKILNKTYLHKFVGTHDLLRLIKHISPLSISLQLSSKAAGCRIWLKSQ